MRKNYLPQAWGPMVQFLRDKRIEINEKQLTLHPEPLTYPIVMSSNDCGFSPCWNVTQSFNIPELFLKMDCSLHVIPGSLVKGSSTQYIIQSLSLVLQPI